MMRSAALEGNLVEQIRIPFLTNLSQVILWGIVALPFGSPATQVSKDGKTIVLYVWYDNEHGYTRR